VRRGSKGVDDGGVAARRRRGGDSPIGRHGHEAEEREEGRGRRSARVRAHDEARSRVRATGGATRRRGVGRGASAAVGWRGVAGSGLATVLTGGA
jgi:hypothetical protein